MTEVEELQEKAAGYFQQRPPNFPDGRPYNCCESVLLALSEHLGIESDLIPKIVTGVGAGFSLNGLTCGCISGAAIAIGIRYGRDRNEESPQVAWKKVSQFIESFKDRWSATACRGLTGPDLKTPEGLKQYYQSVHDYACTDRIRFSVGKAMELLKE